MVRVKVRVRVRVGVRVRVRSRVQVIRGRGKARAITNTAHEQAADFSSPTPTLSILLQYCSTPIQCCRHPSLWA